MPDVLEQAKAAEGDCGDEYEHCKLPEIIEGLVAECEQLQAEVIAENGEVGRLIEANNYLQDELTRWQKLAVEETARRIHNQPGWAELSEDDIEFV